MLKFIILFFVFLGILIKSGKRKGWKTSSSWILFIYVLSLASAIPTLITDGFKEPFLDAYIVPSILFGIALVLYLLPLISYDETFGESFTLPSIKILDTFSSILIVLSFFSIAFFLPSVNHIFTMADLGDARNDLYAGTMYVEAGLSNTIASVSASLYVFAIVLFFVYLIIGNSKKRCVLLLLSSLSEIIHVLAYVGRDGVVFWIFSFVFIYLYFSPYLSSETNKKIIKNGLIGIGILMIPFMLISIGRFADSSDYDDTSSALLSYLGQGPINAVLFYGIDNPPMSNGSCFPLFWEVTGITPPVSDGMVRIGEWRSWAFSTFIVDYYRTFGFWGHYIVGLFLYFLFNLIIGNKRCGSFSSMIVYLLYFQVISEGLFYFHHYTRGGNLFIVLCFILCFVFKMLEKDSNRIVLYKQNR